MPFDSSVATQFFFLILYFIVVSAIKNKAQTALPVIYYNFEGHVTPTEDGFQKICPEKFRYCLPASEFTVSLLITCILAFEIGHFRKFWTSVNLTLDRHGTPPSSTHRPLPTYMYEISLKSEKLFL